MKNINISTWLPIITFTIGIIISHIYHSWGKRKYKVEKAIGIAEEFEKVINSDNIKLQSIFNDVLVSLDFQDKLSFIDEDPKNLFFNGQELREHFTDNEISKYRNFISLTNTRFLKILANHYSADNSDEGAKLKVISNFIENKSISDNLSMLIEQKVDEYPSDESSEEEYEKRVNQQKKYNLEIIAFIEKLARDYEETYNQLFNKLEWMSMYFVTGIADSDAVYKSLNKVYFTIVKVFYIELVLKNDRDSYDRYFTNVIMLYKMWRIKYNREKKKFDKIKNNSEKKLWKLKGKV